MTLCLATALSEAGSRVYIRPCSSISSGGEKGVFTGAHIFSYRRDYRLLLTNSVKVKAMVPLCLTVRSVAFGESVYLATCDQPNQQWGYDASPEFSVVSGSARFCLGTPTLKPPLSQFVALAECQSSYDNTKYGVYFRPDNGVGAGAALTTDENVDNRILQWVNYAQYGRCMEFKDWGGKAPEHYNEFELTACRNDPVAGTVGWNQMLSYAASAHQLQMRYGQYGDSYNSAVARNDPLQCLTSAGVNNKPGLGVCSAADSRQKWTVLRLIRGNLALSYTIRWIDGDTNTANDQCLDAGTPSTPFGPGSVSSMTLRLCDGSSGQKWNAPPVITDGGIGSLQENDPGK